MSDKLYPKVKVNSLPTFQIPCKTSSLLFLLLLSPTSSTLSISYITSVQKGEKFLTLKQNSDGRISDSRGKAFWV